MNSVLDFTGALIYFVLNIVLFPLFMVVHGLLLFWTFEKYAAFQLRKFMVHTRQRNFQVQEGRSLAFIRKTFRVSH
jgi:hypothetical protein